MGARDGQISREEQLAHLAAGRSLLFSPVLGKDDKGNPVVLEPGKHVVRRSELPGVLAGVLDDPAKLAAYRAETQRNLAAAQAEHEAAERAQADLAAKALGRSPGGPTGNQPIPLDPSQLTDAQKQAIFDEMTAQAKARADQEEATRKAEADAARKRADEQKAAAEAKKKAEAEAKAKAEGTK